MDLRRLLSGFVILVCFSSLVIVFGQEGTTSVGAETANQLDEIRSGEQVYGALCVSCHGAEGEGEFGPSLAGNQRIQDDTYTVRQIVLGGGGMPAFGPPQLSEERIANVATYIRSGFGNDFGEVSTDRVAEIVDQIGQ